MTWGKVGRGYFLGRLEDVWKVSVWGAGGLGKWDGMAAAAALLQDKLKKADESELVLKKSFENMGVSMQDMMAMITQGTGFGGKGASICHFVNLSEDAHDDGLIYMIPPGTTKIKKYEDEDEEVCIKLDGDSIKPIHAILESLESSGVTIHPATEGAVLWVNGNALSMKDKVKLEHGARVILGHDFVFRPGIQHDST